MNNHIAINMIKSYLCSTQIPNNTYLGSTLIPKVLGVCDDDNINLGTTSNTHCHFTLNHSCSPSAFAGGPPTPSSSLPYVVWADPASRRTPCHIPTTLRYKFL